MKRQSGGARLVVAFFLVTGGLLAGASAETFTRWVESPGLTGILLFAVAYALATVFVVPGSLLTLGGGAGFGLVRGWVAVYLGAVLGSALSFLVSRYLARKRVERWVRSNPRFSAVDRAVGREGFRIVLLTRLSPLFPFVFLNYAFGLTRVGFWQYALATWVGILPGSFMYVYLGTLGRTGLEVAGGEALHGVRIVIQLAGLVATILVTLRLTRIARKALSEAGI